MGVIFSDKYPYTDFHELNLDWLLAQMVKLDKAFETFTSANTLTSADPIDWNIATQYGKNTIVVDPASGIAYLSVQPVPAGIEITNTDYWTPVFEFETLLQEYKDQMLAAYEEYKDELLASFDKYVFYAPNYGIVPDTGEDLYETIFHFLKDTVEPAGGGIVYFPSGTYKTSYTIFIPENTMFVGTGPETVLYFDETDTTFGVALSNGGSNVGIVNMKVNSNNTGTINTTSALPGSIGISNVDDSATTDPYYHTFVRADTENIYIHNVYSDTNYVLQVEPDSSHVLRNITIDGVYAPESMVSLNANDAAENVTYRNIVCDVFRLGTGGYGKHIVADTVKCRTAFFRNYPPTGYTYGNVEPMHVSNLDLNTDGSNSDMNAPARINGTVDFVNCSFDNKGAIASYLLERYYGILSFSNCTFDNFGTLFAANVSPLSNDFCVNMLTNCRAIQTGTGISVIFGHVENTILRGSFRIVDPKNINRLIVGGAADTSIITSQQSLGLRTINISHGTVYLDVYVTITNTSNLNLFTLVNEYLRFPGSAVYVEAWNSSTPGTIEVFGGECDANGVVKYSSAHTAYNRARVCVTYPANMAASLNDIYNISEAQTYDDLSI